MGRRLNVLFYESSSGFGGSANALANLIRHLDPIKYNPFIAVVRMGFQIQKIEGTKIFQVAGCDEPAQMSNLSFLKFFICRIFLNALKISRIIWSHKIDIVHVNTNVMLGLPAIIAAKVARIPCVCHIRDTRCLIRREQYFSRWVTHFVIINSRAFDIYKKDIPKTKLKLIHDGIDLLDFAHVQKNQLRRELRIGQDPLVGLVGRIIAGKGQKEFILSAKEVLKKKHDPIFLIVGDAKGEDGVYYREVVESVHENKLEDKMILTGWRNDIKEIINDFDILVQGTTTFPEGFGLTCIEAMALSKPVIATRVPGPADIVVDGQTGFLVPPGDVKAMADKIVYLLDHPDVAKKMGEAGRERAESVFNIKHTVRQIESIYEELLNGK
ncbi:MAG: glycosyltransferase family 4 protein [Candidatus Omnitrophica bacterium]|nr:glycosyltransferase family 4 protein [Candidatus Omnitrophota bacterium]